MERAVDAKPTSEEGAIIKREWWKTWKKKIFLDLHYIIQSYDTAFSKKETADYSAITTWGVFSPDDMKPALILLDARRGRWDFPELKEIAVKEYNYWEPEMVLVEAKASGMPYPTNSVEQAYRSPITHQHRGNDKRTRVNSIAPMFESGMVYYPEGRTFAEEVIEECAAFPYGENDDYVDTVTQALMRFRQSGLIQLRMDYEEEPCEQYEENILLMKLSDNTSISLPARNLIAILAAVAIGTMSYFSIIERLNKIESDLS